MESELTDSCVADSSSARKEAGGTSKHCLTTSGSDAYRDATSNYGDGYDACHGDDGHANRGDDARGRGDDNGHGLPRQV